jgi:hypothetical protein
MKKKVIIVVVVIIAILFLLVQCGSDSDDNETATTETVAVSEATEEETSVQDSGLYSTKEEVEKYKDSCQPATFSYNDLLRYEDDYKGNDYYFTVTVAQVMDDGSLRANFDENLNDIILEDKRAYDTTKILADDEITAYARYVGTTKITRAATGVEDEVPCFEMYAADISGVTDAEYFGTDMSNLDYSEIYGDILCEYAANDEYAEYSLYDINKDGRKELIIHYGSDGENYVEFYTVDEKGAVSGLERLEDDLVFYEAEDGDGLYGVTGMQGVETVYQVYMHDGQIGSTELWTKEVDEYYENENPLEVCNASDTSLLENAD